LGEGEFTERIVVKDDVTVRATASARGKAIVNFNTKDADTSALIVKVKVTCIFSFFL
jgi:hypothetical protein